MSQKGIYYNKFVMLKGGGGGGTHIQLFSFQNIILFNNDTALILKFLLYGQCSAYNYQIFC
jgi:hypothetical protein